jgi:hemerythrin-like metal-binding protein
VVIVWTEQYSVGVKKLDEQHEQLFTIVNELIANQYAADASNLIPEILEKVTTYASYHFKTEERIMSEYGYPEHASQVRDHTAFSVKIARFCMDAIGRNNNVIGDLRDYLTDWLTRHILQSDVKFKDFLIANGFLRSR